MAGDAALDIPELSDGTVRLRPAGDADVPRMVQACRDPQTVRWTTVPHPYEPRHAREFVAEAQAVWQAGTEVRWAVASAGEDRWLGNIDLRVRRWAGGAADGEVGCLVHPDARGTGVATGALRLLAGHAFDVLAVRRLVWLAEVGNVASRRAAQRAGFTVEGVARGLLPTRSGGRADGWVAALLPGDDRRPTPPPAVEPVWLQGGQVTLRPFEAADAADVLEAATGRRTGAGAGAGADAGAGRLPASPAEALDYVARGAHELRWDGTGTCWAVLPNTVGRPVGAVTLSGLDPGLRCVRVGWWAGAGEDTDGLLAQAVGVAARWAFATWPVDRLEVRLPAGDPQLATVRRLGFADEGVARGAGRNAAGRACDVSVLSVLRGEPIG